MSSHSEARARTDLQGELIAEESGGLVLEEGWLAGRLDGSTGRWEPGEAQVPITGGECH
jgi:hypothetical protein